MFILCNFIAFFLFKAELEKMKKDRIEADDKYELIVRKYELYKIKSKNKVYDLK